MAIDRYNPSEPTTIGLEWPATIRRKVPVDFGAELASIIESPASMSVRYAGLHISGPGIGGGPMQWIGLCTIYAEGDEVNTTDLRTVSSVVVTGSAATGCTLNGGAANVADALAVNGDGKSITIPPNALMRLRFALPTYAVLIPRILSVRFEMVVQADAAANINSIFDYSYRKPAVGNELLMGQVQIPPSGAQQSRTVDTGEIYLGAYDYVASPTERKRAVWTKQDFIDLTTGTVELQVKNPWFFSPKVEYFRAIISYCDENRVAAGAISLASFNGGLVDPAMVFFAELQDPATRSTPITLNANTRYVQTWCRASEVVASGYPLNVFHPWPQFGQAQQISLIAPEGPPECFQMTRLTDGRITSTTRKAPDGGYATTIFDNSGFFPFQFATEPYADVISSGAVTQVQQELISDQGGRYDWLTVTIRAVGDPAPMSFNIGTSTATVSPGMIEAAGPDERGFATVITQLVPTLEMLPGVERTLSTSGMIGGSGHYEIPKLDTTTGNADLVWSSVTYKGVAQRGGDPTFNQATDYPITLSMSVPPVTGLAVAHGQQTLAPAVTGCPQPQAKFLQLDYSSLTWGDIPVLEGEAYVEFFGTTGNWLSTPSATGSATAIAGDITIVAKVEADDWTPGTAICIGGKWSATGNQRSYRLDIDSSGRLVWFWSTTGADNPSATSSAIPGIADGQAKWVGITFDVDDGAGNHVTRFWVSDDNVTFSLFSTITQAGVVAIFKSSADVQIGGRDDGANGMFDGKIMAFRIHSAIGGGGVIPGGSIVFRFVANDDLPPDPTVSTFTATSGHTMTVHRGNAPQTLLVPNELSSFPITGSPLVTGFCAWEVQRSDLIDTTWRDVARITDRTIRTFNDYEARIGVSTSYRVRMVRTDGIAGDWVTVTGFVRFGPSISATSPTATGCDGLVFTSNEDPLATVAYPYLFQGTPTEVFEFVEAGTVVTQRLHMRDYQVAFKPLERGGVQFSRQVIVNAIATPAARLDRGFLALRDLAWESLSYVCVLDTRGNRWLAYVTVPTGTVRGTNEVYIADITIVEVTDRPTVVDMRTV